MRNSIDRLMDAEHCKRWSMVGTTSDSNVATHSFNVAMLAMAIRKEMFNTIACSEQEVCYFALIHDVKEVHTGDIPTPTKNKMRAAGFDPDHFDPEVPDEEEPRRFVKTIVKLADLIDNYLFISQHGQGTRAAVAAREVEGRLARALDEASPDLQRAGRIVLDYVLTRKSETHEERIRAEEVNERTRQIGSFFLTMPNLDRKPFDKPRCP